MMIDADVHLELPSVEALFPYLTAHWREYISQSAFKGPVENPYPPGAPTSLRPDLRVVGGPALGTMLTQIREQVLDAQQLDYAILTCAYGIESIHNPDAAAALASAMNDWQIAAWLDQEPRLRGSIVVPSQQPALAAQEIARVGGHPGFVQVYLPVRSAALYGNRQFQPLYQAAVEHDLAIGLHFGGATGTPPSPVGWPTYYSEEYAGMTQVFQSQLTSLVVEGVFDRFPSLRVTCIESGWTWLPAYWWRIDKEWKGLRREVPWVRRAPSEYIREYCRFTWQPVDAPPDVATLQQVFDQLESPDLLLYASDYPHWHADTAVERDFIAGLPAAVRQKLLGENASSWYRLAGDRNPAGVP